VRENAGVLQVVPAQRAIGYVHLEQPCAIFRLRRRAGQGGAYLTMTENTGIEVQRFATGKMYTQSWLTNLQRGKTAKPEPYVVTLKPEPYVVTLKPERTL
jgi:hypothetical protein